MTALSLHEVKRGPGTYSLGKGGRERGRNGQLSKSDVRAEVEKVAELLVHISET